MRELDHWHPVRLGHEVGRTPVRVELCGRAFVLFRSREGVGALPETCPHRGMPLSEGTVEDGKLVCPYHGWSWGPDGRGSCPGDPELEPWTEALQTREEHGAIWVRLHGEGEVPGFETEGFRHLTSFRTEMPGPLERVLDNFSEAEHTPEVHWMGFDRARMHEVEVDCDVAEDFVHVRNTGHQKRPMKLARLLVGVPPTDRYTIEWTTRFSPVYARFDHYWTGEEGVRDKRVRAWVFFNPIDADRTDLVSFVYVNAGPAWERLGDPLHARFVRWDIQQDIKVLQHMTTDARGATSRFDVALAANRERVRRIYRGLEG